MEKARAEAFSDGVMAVAITLLALNLSFSTHGHLLEQFGHNWPVYAAYVVSFFTVGVVWVNHHALFDLLTRVDRTLLFLNLALLLFIVAIPFATDTLAEYFRSGGSDGRVAAMLYAGVCEGMSICFTLIFAYAHRAEHMTIPLDDSSFRRAIVGFGAGCLFYAIALIAAVFSPALTLVVAGAITSYYITQRTPTAPDEVAEESSV